MLYSKLCAQLSRWALRPACSAWSCSCSACNGRWWPLPAQRLTHLDGARGLLLVLYITALAVAVGVRDAGRLGWIALVALLPRGARNVAEGLIHLCVLVFAVLMADAGWEWLTLKWDEPKPMLGVPEGLDHLPLVISGALIVLFCIEHLIALWRGQSIEPAGV